ncbi:MAG: hypothetical protein H7326_10675 [Bdellovibrionaceae bacterium]|nr:hypothetical protein [Pseudobdellovibrionaceae bacterium]
MFRGVPHPARYSVIGNLSDGSSRTLPDLREQTELWQNFANFRYGKFLTHWSSEPAELKWYLQIYCRKYRQTEGVVVMESTSLVEESLSSGNPVKHSAAQPCR